MANRDSCTPRSIAASTGAAIIGALAILCATSAVVRPQAAPMSKAETAEVAGYVLSMDNVTRVLGAGKELQRVQATDPAFNAAVEAMAGKSLSEQVTLLEGLPKAVTAVRGAGLTVRDFAIAGRAFAGARTLDLMRARGTPISSQMRAMFPVSDAQATFVSTHRAGIDALMKAPVSAPATP